MPPAIIGGVIAGVGAIGSAVIGSSAASSAADTQAAAANHAADLQNQQYQQSREDAAPWRAAGAGAIGQLSDMLKPGYDYTASPGYQWRTNEARRAIEGSAASRGHLFSSGTLANISDRIGGMAAQDFNDQFNRTASVAAGGQQVNSGLAQLGQQAATNSGNALMGGANARASGYVGSANAITGALGGLSSLALSGAFNGGGGGGWNPYARGYEFGPGG